MTGRSYILESEKPGQKDRVVRERSEDGNEAILALPRNLPPEVYSEILDALRRAHRAGREDRSAELLAPPSDMLRNALAAYVMGTLEEWIKGWTGYLGDGENRHVSVHATDDANHTIDVVMATERYASGPKYRVRVLVEEITG